MLMKTRRCFISSNTLLWVSLLAATSLPACQGNAPLEMQDTPVGKGVVIGIWEPNLTPQRNLKAVLIGVNKYRDLPSLAYSGRDCALIRDVLVSKLGVPPEDVIVITDDLDYPYAVGPPTRKVIESQLRQFFGRADSDDLILFFFSGHGVSHDGQAYLLPIDASSEKSYEEGISGEQIRDLLSGCKAPYRLFIIDSCHSGGLASLHQGLTSGNFEFDASVTISSCSPQELSHEAKSLGGGHGVFTYFLAEGLSGQADRSGGNLNDKIEVSELVAFATIRTKRWVSLNVPGKTQTPMIAGSMPGDLALPFEILGPKIVDGEYVQVEASPSHAQLTLYQDLQKIPLLSRTGKLEHRLPPGQYRVEVECREYEPVTKPFFVDPRKPLEIYIELAKKRRNRQHIIGRLR